MQSGVRGGEMDIFVPQLLPFRVFMAWLHPLIKCHNPYETVFPKQLSESSG